MSKIIYILLVFVVLFTGCSSKKYYEPEDTQSHKVKIKDTESIIIDYNADGATLENNKYISTAGMSDLALVDGYKFLNNSNGIILASNETGYLYMNDNASITIMEFEKNVISATISGNLIALGFIDNSIALYNIETKKTVFKEYLKVSVLNDIRIANPIFLNTVILYPTLDGKISVVSKDSKTVVKTINIDPESKVNNVIFLKPIGDTLIAATSKKLFSFTDGKVKLHDLDIKSVAINNQNVFVATLEGKLLKYDYELNLLKSKKFKYAKFHTIGYASYLYALESQGYIIRLDDTFNEVKIFDFSFDEEEKAMIIDDRLYFEDKYILLK